MPDKTHSGLKDGTKFKNSIYFSISGPNILKKKPYKPIFYVKKKIKNISKLIANRNYIVLAIKI